MKQIIGVLGIGITLFLGGTARAQQSLSSTAAGITRLVISRRQIAYGNPQGGIILKEIAVPIATYSGRNVRAEEFSAGDLCGVSGSYIRFAATIQERMASGDPRLSLEERYEGAQDYAHKRKHAVETLVQQGLVLPEDADALTQSVPLPGTAQGKL